MAGCQYYRHVVAVADVSAARIKQQSDSGVEIALLLHCGLQEKQVSALSGNVVHQPAYGKTWLRPLCINAISPIAVSEKSVNTLGSF